MLCIQRFRSESGTAARPHDALLVGEDRDLHPVAQAQLGQDAGNVALDGGLAEVEPGRDLGVRQPLGDQPHDLEFSLAEAPSRGGGPGAGKLSGGQRAQLALTLAVAKRPELLVLDEPIASLDPLARHEFLQSLTEFIASHQVSVVMSSHLVGDLEKVCDYLIVLVASRVQVAGEVSELLAAHRRVTGDRPDPADWPAEWQVISASPVGQQTTLVVRTDVPVHDPAWTVRPIGLEDLVLAYMSRDSAPGREAALEVRR